MYTSTKIQDNSIQGKSILNKDIYPKWTNQTFLLKLEHR